MVSGYRVPLESEIQSSQAIAIGEVIKTYSLHENRDDPPAVTAHVHTIRVLRQLKGRLPSIVSVREENDSSRYGMRAGEQHLLFFSMIGGVLRIDSCGNSQQLPQDAGALEQL